MTTGKIMIFFCFGMGLILALLPHLIWFLCWLCGKLSGNSISYAPFGWTALGLVIVFWSLMAYGYFAGRWKLEVNEIVYANHELPEAFEGFRIVHISDLHLNTFDDSPEQLERFVSSINALEPDIICFTGDLVTIGRSEAEPYTEILKRMSARHGVISVLGNHDFLLYNYNMTDEWQREKAVEELASYERDSLGWHLLRNESFKITAGEGSYITFLGVDNKNCTDQGFKTTDRGDLRKAMEGTDGFRILLSHDPTHWRHEVLPETTIPITLSGHTHKAQVEILGWTPASWMFKESGGMYNEDGQSLYVNAGLGCTAPFRIGAAPEITLLKLKG